MRRLAAVVALGLAAIAASAAADAAPGDEVTYGVFRLDDLDERVAYLDGPIEEHASDDFYSLVVDHPDVALLILNSPGGLTEQARVISELIYALGIDTFIPEGAGCYSACSTIFFGGAQRVAIGELGVHRSFSDERFEDPQEISLLLGYTLESWMHYGIPIHAILATYRTPNEDIHVFTPDEVAEINRGSLMALNRMSDDLLARIALTSGLRYVALDRRFDVVGESRGTVTWELGGTAEDRSIIGRFAVPDANLELVLEATRLGDAGATRIDLTFDTGGGQPVEYIERLTVQTKDGDLIDFVGSVDSSAENIFSVILPARWGDRNDELLFDYRGINLVFSYDDGAGGALLIDKLSSANAVFEETRLAWGRTLPDPAAATHAVLTLPPDPPKSELPLVLDGTATWAFDAEAGQAIVTLRFPDADLWGRVAIGRLEGEAIKFQAAYWSYPDSIRHDGFVSLDAIATKPAAQAEPAPLPGDVLHRGFSLQASDTDISALLAAGWIELTLINADGTASTVAVELELAADDVLARLFEDSIHAP